MPTAEKRRLTPAAFVLAQDRVCVERYPRQTAGDPGSWLLTAVTDPAGTVDFDTLGVAVPVAEIYAGVEFPPAG